MRPTLIDRSNGAPLVYTYWRNSKNDVWLGGHAPIARRQMIDVYEDGLRTGRHRWRFYKLEAAPAALAPSRRAVIPFAERRWRTVPGAKLKATGHAFELLAVLIKIQPATLDEILARAAEDGRLATGGASRRAIVRWYINDLRKRRIVEVAGAQRSLLEEKGQDVK